jgi:nicotinamide-nucleotide amidase
MDAEILAVGSEMLTPQKIDTNSLYLTDQLNALGVEVAQKCVVGDDRERLTSVVRTALASAGLTIVTGGLGPTEDDVTRDAVAAALNRSLKFDASVCDAIEARFRRMNRRMADINRRQAYVIDGAEVLPNERGTAPGQWIEAGASIVVLLPGPPNELQPMWELQCVERLRKKLPPMVLCTRCYRVAGMGESDVDQLIAPVYTRYSNPCCTILAAAGDIQVYLRARCTSHQEAESLLDEVGSQLEPLLGRRLYTRTGEPLEVHVGDLLRARGQTLSVAESCTGGMLAERITQTPGSSEYFAGGFLTYTDEAKKILLGVDGALIEQHTAVSDPVARAMAWGARERLGTDWAVSVTGVAGPDGGTEANPVGTVFIGIAGAAAVDAKRYQFVGDRARIRAMATQTALDRLRLRLA